MNSEPLSAEPALPLTKQERVYEALRERIVTGYYIPGFRLVIAALAKEFGVSALPVREAIRRLEAEGLLIFRPNAGAQVAPVEPARYEDDATAHALLEGYATALAAPFLEPADYAELRSQTDRMVDAMERMDPLAFGRHNRAFHDVIYSRCPNQTLTDLLGEVAQRLDTIRRSVFTHIPYRGAMSIAEHRELIELLLRGAPPTEIEAVARAHKLATVEAFRAWRREQHHDGEPSSAPPSPR